MTFNEKYILNLIEKEQRTDGRTLMDYRKIKIETGISKNAEGSAKVTIGDTEVIVGVKLDLGEPFPDTPDEGTIIVNAELLPLSSQEFEAGPPGTEATELARIIDRGIRESKAIDFKKLALIPGEKIWMVFIDIYTINHAGNLIDASALAAAAALQVARFPKVENNKVVYGEFTNKLLPSTKLPVTCTVSKIRNKFIVDQTLEEEGSASARLSVALIDGKIHAMQKGLLGPLTPEEVEQMIDIAIEKERELRKHLK